MILFINIPYQNGRHFICNHGNGWGSTETVQHIFTLVIPSLKFAQKIVQIQKYPNCPVCLAFSLSPRKLGHLNTSSIRQCPLVMQCNGGHRNTVNINFLNLNVIYIYIYIHLFHFQSTHDFERFTKTYPANK